MFQWDVGNIDRNLRHGVHDWEIEEALFDRKGKRIDTMVINGEKRYLWLGRAASSGKCLRIVYTARRDARGHSLLRPISAVEMSPREKRRYLR